MGKFFLPAGASHLNWIVVMQAVFCQHNGGERKLAVLNHELQFGLWVLYKNNILFHSSFFLPVLKAAQISPAAAPDALQALPYKVLTLGQGISLGS